MQYHILGVARVRMTFHVDSVLSGAFTIEPHDANVYRMKLWWVDNLFRTHSTSERLIILYRKIGVASKYISDTRGLWLMRYMKDHIASLVVPGTWDHLSHHEVRGSSWVWAERR
jgi:hypothetical protein